MQYFHFPIKMLQGVLNKNVEKRRAMLITLLNWQVYKNCIENDDGSIEAFDETAKLFSVNFNSPVESWEDGAEQYAKYEDARVFTGIHRNVYHDFYKNAKSEHDWECLFAHLALKSILGKKKFVKTNNKLMFSRMAGKETQKEYDQIKGFQWSEYHRNKIIDTLQIDWHLRYYSRYTRGFFFSYEMSLEELITHAEESKRSKKKKNLRAKRHKALQAYLDKSKP